MKKFISIFLAAVLCISMTGCNIRTEDNSSHNISESSSRAVADSSLQESNGSEETFRANYRTEKILGEWLWEGDATCVLNFAQEGSAGYTGNKITGIGDGPVEFDWRYIEAAGRYQMTRHSNGDTRMAYFPDGGYGRVLKVFGYNFVRQENWDICHESWLESISDRHLTKAELSLDNISVYMELVKSEVPQDVYFPDYDENKDYYILKSKMHEKGLIYIGGEGDGAWVEFKDGESMVTGGYFIFNSYIAAEKGTVPQIADAGGTMLFARKDYLANYKLEKGMRTVWLIDGSSSTAEGVFVSPEYPF